MVGLAVLCTTTQPFESKALELASACVLPGLSFCPSDCLFGHRGFQGACLRLQQADLGSKATGTQGKGPGSRRKPEIWDGMFACSALCL